MHGKGQSVGFFEASGGGILEDALGPGGHPFLDVGQFAHPAHQVNQLGVFF